MTAYFQALQRQSDGRWDYTRSTGSTKPHPIGYCAGWREYTEEDWEKMRSMYSEGMIEEMKRGIEEKREHKDRYHHDGHATAEEAEYCHDTYLLDALQFHRVEDEQHKCSVSGCDSWAQNIPDIRGESIGPRHWVCDAHANRDAYESTFRTRHKRPR